MNKLKVNEENLKKYPKNVKLSLKKALSVALALTVVPISAYGIHKSYTNVSIPNGFSEEGSSIGIGDRVNVEKEQGKFVIIEVNNWENGVSKQSVENMSLCEENNIPYGIMVNSTSTTEKQTRADAASVLALTENKNVECPIYYNIDTPSLLLSDDELVTICDAFESTFIAESENTIGFAGKKDSLDKLSGKFDDVDKLVICDEKEIDYTGTYSMCYFTRTDDYYSNISYVNKKDDNEVISKEDELLSQDSTTQKALKGIDVSEHQGDIDWESVKEEGVQYAIIRFSSFKTFHDNGDPTIDSKFFENVSECERLGIPYGIYCYTTADTPAEAIEEAKVVVNTLDEMGGIKMSMPIYYDIEMEKHFDNPKLAVEETKAFKSVIETAGYDSAVYASYSLLKEMVEIDPTIKDSKNWVAYYRYDEKRDFDEVYESHIPDMPDIGPYSIVQVTQHGELDGITENTVDVNFDVTGISKIDSHNVK